MSLRNRISVPEKHPIATELGVVTVALVVVSLWSRAVRTLAPPLAAALGAADAPGMPLVGVLTGGLFVAGLLLFARVYVVARGVDVRLHRSPRAVRCLGAAIAVPLVFVALTGYVGVVTGVPYGSLTQTSYGSVADRRPILAVLALSTFVGVPSLVVCQVLVQGSFSRAMDGDGTVVATTAVTGFALLGHSGLTAVPGPGKLLGIAAFALLVGVVAYARDHVERASLRRLAALPVLLFAALVVVSGVVEVESLAGGLFAVAHLAVLGVAAYTYERSDSVVPPAFAYLSASLANAAVVLLEAGLRPW